MFWVVGENNKPLRFLFALSLYATYNIVLLMRFNNFLLLKEINCFNVDWFTFKGGKTEYRLCGDEIYAITGPERHYVLIE